MTDAKPSEPAPAAPEKTQEVDVTQEVRAPHARKRRSAKRWVFRLAVLIFLVAVWFVWRWVTSPRFLNELIVENLQPYVNGSVKIDEVRLRSLNDVRFKNLSLTLKGDKKPSIEVKGIRVNLIPWGFLDGEVDVLSAAVVDPVCRLTLDAKGESNLDRLFVLPSAPKPKPDTKAKTQPSSSGDESLLSGGVTYENGKVILRSRTIFGDDEPRRLGGIYGVWRREPSSVNLENFSGVIQEAPIRGARFTGWLRANDPYQFRIRVAALGLRLTPGLIYFLPDAIRRRFEPFEPTGWVTLDTMVDMRASEDPEYFLEMELCGCGMRIPDTPLEIEAIQGEVRMLPSSLVVRCDSAFFCEGQLKASASLTTVLGGKQRLRGFVGFEGVSMTALMKRLAPKEPPKPGILEGWFRISGDPARAASLDARGEVKLSRAELLQLPVFAKVLSILNLSISSAEVIRSGDVRFRLDLAKGRVLVDELRLLSPNVQIAGKGWIGFDSKLDMRLVVSIPKTEAKGLFTMLKRVYESVVGGVQSIVTPPIRITGTLQKPEAQVMALQYYGKPVTDLFDLLNPLSSSKKGKE